jgi:hypothetical protein
MENFVPIPLGLISAIPGNQTYFTIENTFSNLNLLWLINMQRCNGIIILEGVFSPEFHLCENLRNHRVRGHELFLLTGAINARLQYN